MKKEFTILDTGLADRTGRRYPEETIKREVERLQGTVWGAVVGELGIGQGDGIHLDRVSHKIVDVRFEDGKMFGTVQTMETPCGRMLNALFSSTVSLATALRGLGKVDEKGFVSEYTLISVDIIVDPEAKED